MYFSSSFFLEARQVSLAEMVALGIPEGLIQELIKPLAFDKVLARRGASFKQRRAQ